SAWRLMKRWGARTLLAARARRLASRGPNGGGSVRVVIGVVAKTTGTVANWRLLDMGPWEPEALWRSAFLLDENVPWRVAVPFAALERYILEEIGHIGAAQPGVPPDGTASFC